MKACLFSPASLFLHTLLITLITPFNRKTPAEAGANQDTF